MSQSQNQGEHLNNKLQSQQFNEGPVEQIHIVQTNEGTQNNQTKHQTRCQNQQESLQLDLRQHNQQNNQKVQYQNPYLQEDNYGKEIDEMDFQNYQNKFQDQFDINQQRSVQHQQHYNQEQRTQNFENYEDYQTPFQIHNRQKLPQEQVHIEKQIILDHQHQNNAFTQKQNDHLLNQNANSESENFPEHKQNDNDSVNSFEGSKDKQELIKPEKIQKEEVLQKQAITTKIQTEIHNSNNKQSVQNSDKIKAQQQSKSILAQSPINKQNQPAAQLKNKQNKNLLHQTNKNHQQDSKNLNQTPSKKKKNKKQKSQIKNQAKLNNNQHLQNQKKVEQQSSKVQDSKNKIKQKKSAQGIKQKKTTQDRTQKKTTQGIAQKKATQGIKQNKNKESNKENKGDKSQKQINNNSNSSSDCSPEQPKKNQDFAQKQRQQTINVSQIKSQVPLEPIVPANFIIKQAQKQRIGSTFQYFQKYMNKHDKHVNNQKKLISNIQGKVQAKKLSKYPIQSAIKQYFQTYISMCKDFHQKSYKFSRDQKIYSTNPLLNIRQQLKTGFQQLIFQRKSTGNDYQRMSEFIQNVTLSNLTKIFDNYWNGINLAQKKQKQKRDAFDAKEKQFKKRVAKIQKIYTKGRQGISQTQDVFVEMAKFIRMSKQFRLYLIDWGRNLYPLKKAVIREQQQLFQDLQLLLNEFKNQTKSVYSLNRKQFSYIQKFEKVIKQVFTFSNLCDLTDLDYVKSVLELHQKGQNRQANDKDFQSIFQMNHFDNLVGNSNQLLKGSSSKIFQMKTPNEELIETISGNLVVFNRQKCEEKDKFVTKNINVKIVGDGVIQIDELMVGIIFDSNRTVRITLRDNDRAEQLIFFLNNDAQREAEQQKIGISNN